MHFLHLLQDITLMSHSRVLFVVSAHITLGKIVVPAATWGQTRYSVRDIKCVHSWIPELQSAGIDDLDIQ